jgi:hypothetical protein
MHIFVYDRNGNFAQVSLLLVSFPPSNWGMDNLPPLSFTNLSDDQLRDFPRPERALKTVHVGHHAHVERMLWLYCVISKQSMEERTNVHGIAQSMCDFILYRTDDYDAVSFCIFP